MADDPGRPDGSRRELSFAMLALGVSGAGVVVLVATVVVVALVPAPPWGLALIVLAGIAGSIAAMGVVSHRLTSRALDEPADGGGDR